MNTEKLFSEVKHLHDSNVVNAQKTAENAVRIGVVLHQIKEDVGHGNFIPSMREHVPQISQQCCSNYMRLATERLIEEKARLLIPETTTTLPTVGNLPTVGKLPTVGNLTSLIGPISPISLMPPNAIPADDYEQARKEVAEMRWSELPPALQSKLYKNIRGKDLMDLYRGYGIIRAKEIKVYHPPKRMTPEEKLAADREQAEALLDAAERAFDGILRDLISESSKLATLVAPARIKEFLRAAVGMTKTLRPLAKRKQSPLEKKAETKTKVRALTAAVESCQAAMTKEPAKTPKPFGWEVRVAFHPGSGKQDQTFHLRGCSEKQARRHGMMKRNAASIVSVEPVETREQWVGAYGIGKM